jgi:hypothetical protein
VLGVAALDAGVRIASRPARTEALPGVAAFDPAAATSIRIGRTEADLVLERGDGGWRITAPVALTADETEVGALLAELAGGVHPELRVDDDAGDHARYGLAGGDELALEVRGEAGPLLSLVVGHDAGGGATWIRLPDAPDVYRARIGGRARLDRPVGAWRDRALVGVSADEVVTLRIAGVVDARRADGGWVGDVGGGEVDRPTVARVVEGLVGLRAAGAVPADRDLVWDGPEVVLGLADGADIALGLGHAGGAWVAQRHDEGGDVVRLAAPWLDGLQHEATFRDRSLWSGGDVMRLEVRGPGLDGVLEATSSGFAVRRPGNVDVDPARAEAAVRFLAAPRVIGWGTVSPSAAGFPSDHRWTVTTGDTVHVLSLGATDGDAVWVRSEARPDAIGRLDLRTVRGVEALFGG